MSDDIVQTAKAEETKLIAELRSVPLFVKLQAIQALIAAYAVPDQAQTSLRITDTVLKNFVPYGSMSRDSVARLARRLNSKATAHAQAAQAFLIKRGSRAQTREIMDALEAEGIAFEDENAMNALASTLSRSPLFNNVRGKGYGLAAWEEADEAPPARQPSGLPYQEATESYEIYDEDKAPE